MPEFFEKALVENLPEHVHNFLIGCLPVPINIRNKASETALMIACANKSYDTVEELLDNANEKPDFEATDAQGWTALHHAAKSGCTKSVEKLLGLKVLINSTTNQRETALMIASAHKSFGIVELLLDNAYEKPVLEATDAQGWTAIHHAAKSGCFESIKTLQENGALVNAITKEGETALHLATINEQLDAVTLFAEHRDLLEKLTKGKHYYDISQTAMHIAARKGLVKICKVLLKHGAKVDALNNLQMTPLHYAAMKCHDKVCQLLLEHGAKVNALNIRQWTPLQNAALNDHDKVCQLLLEHGAKVNALDEYESTPLHEAARHGRDKVCQLLLKHGAKVNALNDSQETPLHFAVINGHYKLCQLLLKHGAKVDALDEYKLTLLHKAEDMAMPRCANLFLNFVQ